MERLIYITRDGRNTIEIYTEHAEIVLEDRNHNESARVMIDIDDVDRCKEHRWYVNTGEGGKYARSLSAGSLQRFILEANNNTTKVKFIDGNTFNCKKVNLQLYTKNNPEPEPVTINPTASNKTMPSPIIVCKNYAEIVVIRKNNTEIRVKIDLDDVDKCKDYYWKDYTDSYYSKEVKQLHRYIMNATDDVYVKFRNNDKTDCRKTNLYFEPKCKKSTPTPTSKPESAPKSSMIKRPSIANSNKNYKNITQSNQGYVILLPIPNKDENEFHGPFSTKEQAIAVYEKRVDEIYRAAAMDSYETLVANLKESDPYGLYE